jgi:hypothetical protein
MRQEKSPSGFFEPENPIKGETRVESIRILRRSPSPSFTFPKILWVFLFLGFENPRNLEVLMELLRTPTGSSEPGGREESIRILRRTLTGSSLGLGLPSLTASNQSG